MKGTITILEGDCAFGSQLWILGYGYLSNYSAAMKRAILGSIADEVIREPGIPVLAIRPER